MSAPNLWDFQRASLVLQVVVVCLLPLAFIGCNRPLHSSPTALRDTNAYVKAVSLVPPGPVDLTVLDQTTASMEGETLVATMPSSTGAENSIDGLHYVVKRLAPGEKLEGDGATFEMVAFSVSGPGISKRPAEGKRSVPLDFFAPGGAPLAKEELKAMGFKDWQLEEYVDGNYSYIGESFPEVKVWLGSTSQPPGYFRPVGLFDARTKRGLVSGNSYSQVASNSFGYAELRPRAWHATPMELVLNVELDGKAVVETNAVAGMSVPVAGGVVRMLGIWNGDSSSWSSSSGSPPGTQTTRIDLREREDTTNSVALFVTAPPQLSVHVALLDGQGKEFSGNGGGTSGGLRVQGVRARAEEVKQVRFTVLTNHYRVVIPLPPIPNLPAAGRGAANLFSVPVPVLNIQREYELRDVIGQLTQMDFLYPPGGDLMPTNLFPMTLTNVTAADLISIYQRGMTNSYAVLVDESKQEIRVQPTWYDNFRRWMKRNLRL